MTDDFGFERARNSFKASLREAVRQSEKRVRWIDRLRLGLVLRNRDAVNALEEECIRLGVAAGVIAPAAVDDSNGLLVGDWQDFIQMLIDNLPEILAFIEALVKIISMFGSILIFLCLNVLSSASVSASAQIGSLF